MKKILVMVLVIGGLSSLFAGDYFNAKYAKITSNKKLSYSSATQVATSRAVCHRATGNLSSCTNELGCGSTTIWPTISQYRKFKKHLGKGNSYRIWITKGSSTLCTLR